MKNIYLLILSFILTLAPINQLCAEDVDAALLKIGSEVAALQLGFDDYVIGKQLTEQQKDFAQKNLEKKSVKGSYKFYDAGVFVVVSSKNDMIIGIYKENAAATKDDVKTMIGELMMRFEEPTTMAHDKMIYWAFGKDGLITQPVFDMERTSGGSDVLATVKFSSSQEIRPTAKPDEEAEKEVVKEEPAKIYAMITSDKLSKIFLAQNK